MKMKQQVRVLGIDDSPFSLADESVLVVGVVVRLPNYVEGIMKTSCKVDGSDGTDALIQMINQSRFRSQLKLVMIDGVALGGFNVIDISRLFKEVGIALASITRDYPDMERIERALLTYFPNGRERLEIVRSHPLTEIGTEHNSIWAAVEGLDRSEAERLIRASTIRGAIPEPLRIAHLIATAMVKGESHGRA